MRHFTIACILSLMAYAPYTAHAQQSDSTSVSVLEDNSNTPKRITDYSKNNKKRKNPTGKKENQDDKSMFKENTRAWSIDIHGGYPFLRADIQPNFGIGYGFNVRKAMGYSTSLRINAINGYTTGLDYKFVGTSDLKYNTALNGSTDPRVNYFSVNKGAYLNYKMKFTKFSLEAVYNVNNLNFLKDDPRISLYLFAGMGGMLYSTYVDQLNGNGQMYDYSPDKIPVAQSFKDRKPTIKALKNTLDGTYETPAEGNNYQYEHKMFQKNFTAITTAGLGFNFKVTNRVAVSLETMYGYTGKDILDGQRWFNNYSLTMQPDAFWYSSVGINIRLGRVNNISWFDNPLTMPYKTIMENKKKIKKLDGVDDKVNTLSQKQDSLSGDVSQMKSDDDNDGVPNFTDKEDSTPSGAVVDGAGRTIFYKDNDGNLVFNDPNYSEAAAKNNMNQNGSNGNNVSNNYYGNNGNNGNGNNGNNYNDGSNKGTKPGKYVFNKNDKSGKTIIMQGDGKGGYNGAGTSSRIGFLPAVFFETDKSVVNRESYPDLYEIARLLKINPQVKLYVIGFCDYRNSDGYNKGLGMRRAKAVFTVLTKYFGVSPDQLITETRGEAEPLTNLKNMSALQANRRVQFEIVGNPMIKGEIGRDATIKTSSSSSNKTYQTDPKTPKPNEIDKDINKLLQDTKPLEEENKPKGDTDVFKP